MATVRPRRRRPRPSSTFWCNTPRTCRSRTRTRRARSAPQQQQPAINIQINVSANALAENEYEVTLQIEGKAENGGMVLFNFELAYAGVFRIQNVPKDNLHPVVMIECPRLLFPFAREIIATAVRDGGFPPLLLDPVDFVGLYRQNLRTQTRRRPRNRRTAAELTASAAQRRIRSRSVCRRAWRQKPRAPASSASVIRGGSGSCR